MDITTDFGSVVLGSSPGGCTSTKKVPMKGIFLVDTISYARTRTEPRRHWFEARSVARKEESSIYRGTRYSRRRDERSPGGCTKSKNLPCGRFFDFVQGGAMSRRATGEPGSRPLSILRIIEAKYLVSCDHKIVIVRTRFVRVGRIGVKFLSSHAR